MKVRIEEGWHEALAGEFDKPYFAALTQAVRHCYAEHPGEVYPPAGRVFAAFDECPFHSTKVVIIGQDPYHGPGQATGLSFSVPAGVQMPPSLVNIFKEVCADTGAPFPENGDLTRWARQGVLMLNSSLTVERGRPKSHAGLGWETFTDAAVNALNTFCEHLVFILWGSDAIKKGVGIDRQKHLVLTSPHPSPLSAYRGFFGNKHFSKANEYLKLYNKEQIIW